MRVDKNFDGKVNKWELFNLFKYFTVQNWQVMPATSNIFVNWGLPSASYGMY